MTIHALKEHPHRPRSQQIWISNKGADYLQQWNQFYTPCADSVCEIAGRAPSVNNSHLSLAPDTSDYQEVPGKPIYHYQHYGRSKHRRQPYPVEQWGDPLGSKQRVFKGDSGPNVLLVEAEEIADTVSSSASNEELLVAYRKGEDKPNSAAVGDLSGGHNHLGQQPLDPVNDLSGLATTEAEAEDSDVRKAVQYTSELLWDLPLLWYAYLFSLQHCCMHRA